MEILYRNRIFDCGAGAGVGCFSIDRALFDAAAEQDYRTRGGEVAVHAVVLRESHDVRRLRLIFDFFADFAFGDGVAPELTGEHDEGAVEQAPLFEIEDELGDGGVDPVDQGA